MSETETTSFEDFQSEAGPQSLEEAIILIDGVDGADHPTAPFQLEHIDLSGGQLVRVTREGNDAKLVLKAQKAIAYYRDWLGRLFLLPDETWEEARERLRNRNRRDRDA